MCKKYYKCNKMHKNMSKRNETIVMQSDNFEGGGAKC